MPTAGPDALPKPSRVNASSRDGYHHGDLRAACIAGALRLVEEGGPDAVTIRGVARLTGVSHQAPLHYFRDRDALLHEVAERGFEQLLERLGREVRPGAGPLESLRTYGVVYVLHAVEHPGLFQVMFAPCDDPPGEEAYRRLIELCAACQGAGELPGEDPFRLGLLVWSTVHGLAALYGHMGLDSGASGQPTDARVAAERTLDDLIAGLTAGGAHR